MNKEKNFASAVIYAHNAENIIGSFMQKIIMELEANFEHSEIICVNDCSDDNTVQAIRSASDSASNTSVSVLNMSYFHGLELSMNAGVDLAIGDFVFEFDNPYMDYDVSEIMKVYCKSLQGYDIVSAVPDRKEQLSSALFYKVFGAFSNLSYEMHTESFRVLSRRIINRIGAINKTVPYRKAIYAACGLKTSRIVYKPICSGNQFDKKGKAYRRKLAGGSLILFTDLGYKFSMSLTMLMILISVFMLAYSVIIYAPRHPVAGWTTTILFLSMAFFGLFGIVTIIVKNLELLISLNFKRKQYCFESIEKLTK